MDNILIISPFNGVFFGMLFIFLAASIWLIVKRQNNTVEENSKLLSNIYLAVFIIFIIYKLALPLDKEYMEVYAVTWGKFTYLNEIPFNPCTLSLWLSVIALKKNSKPLKLFCFYTLTFAPLLALITPLPSFYDTTLLSIHNLGYYIVHFAILMLPILFVGLRILEPSNKDIPKYILTFVVVTFCVFILDVILRKTGLCESANFFFTIDNEDNPILVLLSKYIHIPFVYELPALIALIPECFVVNLVSNGIVKLCRKIKAKKAN